MQTARIKWRDSRRDIPFPLPTNYVKLPRGKTHCRSRLQGDSLSQSLYWPMSCPPANVPENVQSKLSGRSAMIGEHRARDGALIQQDPAAVTPTWNHSGGELLLSVRLSRLRQMGTPNASRAMGGGGGCEPQFFLCNFTVPGVQNVTSPILKRMFYCVNQGLPGAEGPGFSACGWTPAA